MFTRSLPAIQGVSFVDRPSRLFVTESGVCARSFSGVGKVCVGEGDYYAVGEMEVAWASTPMWDTACRGLSPVGSMAREE